MKIQYLVDRLRSESVVLLWTADYEPDSPFHRVLDDCLRYARGVEYVSVHRYGAELDFALHVASTPEDRKSAVRQALEAASGVLLYPLELDD